MVKSFKNPLFLLLLLTLLGGILRLYNLDWGSPFFFHPDERNVASSVSKVTFPNEMNPQFFAYGSLPIYTIYFTGVIVNWVSQGLEPTHVAFEHAILISRFYSALFSVLLIPLLFIITSKLTANRQSPTAGLLAAFLSTASVGFIQFAHFGTFEMWLTFFGVLLFWLCLRKITDNTIFLMGLVFGALVATKVSSIALLPLPLIAIIINSIRKKNPKSEARNPKQFQNTNHQNAKRFEHSLFDYLNLFRHSNFDIRILRILKNTLLLLFISASIYIITNPFVFHDYASFKSSMQYESRVALGTLPVFYTGEFYDAIPGLFHFLYVYPFLLNPFITILFIPAFFYLAYKTFKTRNLSYALLLSFFLILFLSQIFLFVKWTRYMVPTLPFIYVILAIALSHVIARYEAIRHLIQKPNGIAALLPSLAMTIIIAVCTIFSLSYFITAFVQPDTRIVANNFAGKTIAPNTPILSEVYDLGIMPFNNAFQNITIFNFYDLDPTSLTELPTSQEAATGHSRGTSPTLPPDLQAKLQESEYIILPSQRLLKIRTNNPEKFPNGAAFYNDLITGKLGYEQIYQTPCDIFCKITYLRDPVYRYEETANVFDRPTVFIFRRK